MTLHAPQLIWLSLMALSIGKAIALYGQPKKQAYYDWIDFPVGPAISLGLLYWGGFFG